MGKEGEGSSQEDRRTRRIIGSKIGSNPCKEQRPIDERRSQGVGRCRKLIRRGEERGGGKKRRSVLLVKSRIMFIKKHRRNLKRGKADTSKNVAAAKRDTGKKRRR